MTNYYFVDDNCLEQNRSKLNSVGAFGSGSGRVGGGRWGQAAHAQSVGKALENAELCRAARTSSWTPPLGTTAAVLEVSPGDCGSGGRLLTGVNNQAIPGKKRTTSRLSAPRQALDDPAPSPPSPPSASSCFGRCCRRTCRISARPPQTRRTAQRSSGRSGRRATTAGVTMLLLAPGGRRCLHRCCAWTLGCQLLLWILCAVNADERSFNVEVNPPAFPHSRSSLCVLPPSAVVPQMLLRLMATSPLVFRGQQALCWGLSWALSPLISFWESFTGKFGWNVSVELKPFESWAVFWGGARMVAES